MIAFPASVGMVGPASGGGGTDPYFANVVSLLHLDGTNGSTTITDVIGKTWSTVGTAQLSTATKKYGTAALDCHVSGDAISTTASPDWAFGTGDFTIEGWVYITSSGRGYWYSNNDNDAAIIINPGTGAVEVYGPGSWVINAGATVFPTSTWIYLSLSRQGNAWYFHRDGSLYVSNGSDSRSWGTNNILRIGRYSGGLALIGHYDDQRITKGVGRYGSGSYTPPTAAHPDS